MFIFLVDIVLIFDKFHSKIFFAKVILRSCCDYDLAQDNTYVTDNAYVCLTVCLTGIESSRKASSYYCKIVTNSELL